MIWHIQVVDSENNIRQQVDFEGSEENAQKLSMKLHSEYKIAHPEPMNCTPDRPRRSRHRRARMSLD